MVWFFLMVTIGKDKSDYLWQTNQMFKGILVTSHLPDTSVHFDIQGLKKNVFVLFLKNVCNSLVE